MALIKRLRKAKKAAPEHEKPEIVNTHLRNMIIVPEMVGSVVGVYNGKVFMQVEVKADMVGHYLGMCVYIHVCICGSLMIFCVCVWGLIGEFSLSYKPVQHGRAGVGATNSSRFIPLK